MKIIFICKSLKKKIYTMHIARISQETALVKMNVKFFA